MLWVPLKTHSGTKQNMGYHAIKLIFMEPQSPWYLQALTHKMMHAVIIQWLASKRLCLKFLGWDRLDGQLRSVTIRNPPGTMSDRETPFSPPTHGTSSAEMSLQSFLNGVSTWRALATCGHWRVTDKRMRPPMWIYAICRQKTMWKIMLRLPTKWILWNSAFAGIGANKDWMLTDKNPLII